MEKREVPSEEYQLTLRRARGASRREALMATNDFHAMCEALYRMHDQAIQPSTKKGEGVEIEDLTLDLELPGSGLQVRITTSTTTGSGRTGYIESMKFYDPRHPNDQSWGIPHFGRELCSYISGSGSQSVQRHDNDWYGYRLEQQLLSEIAPDHTPLTAHDSPDTTELTLRMRSELNTAVGPGELKDVYSLLVKEGVPITPPQ